MAAARFGSLPPTGQMSTRERAAAAALRSSPGTTADAGVQATIYDEDYTVDGLRAACQRLGLRSSGLKAELIARLNHRAMQL